MPMSSSRHWDIFCKVIDNYGDIGVCWRLSTDLAARGEQVRLWVDDASALAWMAPGGCEGVDLMAWTEPFQDHGAEPGDVMVEAFGCDIAPEVIAKYVYKTGARGINRSWINLEYLSAEGFAQRSHGLPSPVMSGPGKGLIKHFFYPGFTPDSGGLLRESNLVARQATFQRDDWLRQQGIPVKGERLISLFCYEPTALKDLLHQLARSATPTRLLVTSGRAKNAVLDQIYDLNAFMLLNHIESSLSISYLPPLTQLQFDELLWACDVNFVRGEDSLVRAIWAGKPFIWQIYPQHDNAHHDKLEAFMQVMAMPESQRQFHRVWNGISPAPLPEIDLQAWQTWASEARAGLLAQASLVERLLEFTAKTR